MIYISAMFTRIPTKHKITWMFLEFYPTYRNNARVEELLPPLSGHRVAVQAFLQPNCQLCGFTKASFPFRFPNRSCPTMSGEMPELRHYMSQCDRLASRTKGLFVVRLSLWDLLLFLGTELHFHLCL